MKKIKNVPYFIPVLLIFGMVIIAMLPACSSNVTPTQIAPTRTIISPSAVVATPTQVVVPPTTISSQPITLHTIQDFYTLMRKISKSPPSSAQIHADDVWQTLLKTYKLPLRLGDYVAFLYKGDAEMVEWRGAFNNWGVPGLEGIRIGETDLWFQVLVVPPASRMEYKIVLNGQEWIIDPVNPDTQRSGLTGDNSVVTMPGFIVTDESQPRIDVEPGTLTSEMPIDSINLGYTVNYRVYLPVGYEYMPALPVLYVLDGNDFLDDQMGALPIILDNLIADERIQPVLVVFVDSREPGNPQVNRREMEFLAHPLEHALFISDELVPAIDDAYRTNPHPEARTILGVSYGGISAIYIAASQTDIFQNIAAFSPSLWVLDSPEYLTDPRYVEGSQVMYTPVQAATICGGDTSITCPSLPMKVFLTAGIPDWDVGDFSTLVDTLVSQNYPLEYHRVNEGHTWSAWRGLSDEMLMYFFDNN
jgi:enterochelin esterase-like enzyme